MNSITASIVVLTYNQLENCTIPCVDSILRNTPASSYELIVVDNASTDGTPRYLQAISSKHEHVCVILNKVNKGYAGGNNDGIKAARGEIIILLNNDTLVAEGWLEGLMAPFSQRESIGLVGPVSNSVGNEQRVWIEKLAARDFELTAKNYTARHGGATFTPDRLGFFCVAIRREVIDAIGLLDENFGVGMFEDDDYCIRAQAAGFELMVTEGVFIYHKGSASFSQLGTKEYTDIFTKNKKYFTQKHNRAWTFSDMALSFWEKLNTDLAEYMVRSERPDPAVERAMNRLQIFRSLLISIRNKEVQAEAAMGTPGLDEAIIQSQWAVRREVFMNEFVRGNWTQRKHYLRSLREYVFNLF